MPLARKPAPPFSTSTDPVAASLTATFRSADIHHAARPDEPHRGSGGQLDIAALYPDLFAPDQAPPVARAVRGAVSLVSELAAAFRGAPVPKI